MNTFSPILDEYSINSSRTSIEQIIVLLDTSGSTHNNGSRGRCRREIIQDTEETTKAIMYAISEGASHCLSLLSNSFNLQNVKFILASFDSGYHQSLNIVLDSSSELYEYAKNLDSLLIKEFSSTDMTLGLISSFNDFTKNTLLILASDGRPNDSTSVLRELDRITYNFKINSKTLDIFIIGAGSIQESLDGSRNFSSVRYSRHFLDISNDQIIQHMRTNSTAECDHKFLTYLSEKGRIGAYSGAYKDYSDLKIGFINFLEQIKNYQPYQEKSFYVKLDNGNSKLSDELQYQLKTLIKNNGDYLLTEFNRQYYIIIIAEGIQPYQIHVEEIHDYNSTINYNINSELDIKQCFIENIDELNKSFFDIYSNVEYQIPRFALDAIFVAIDNGTKRYFKPDLNHYRNYKVRRIIIK